MLTCRKCNNKKWRKGLCYQHWKESQGFVFDTKSKLFVKHEKEKKK